MQIHVCVFLTKSIKSSVDINPFAINLTNPSMKVNYVMCFDGKAGIQSIDCLGIYLLFSQSEAVEASERRMESVLLLIWWSG